MKSTLYLVAAWLVVLGLSSCLPEERIWWSPQGDRAVVKIDDQLHLVGVDGEPGPALDGTGPQAEAIFNAVSWLEDGSGFVCRRVLSFKTWAQVQPLIPTEEAKEIDDLLPAVSGMLGAAAKLARDAKTLEHVVAALPGKDRDRLMIAVQRAFQENPVGIEKLLLQLPSGEEIVEGLKKEEAVFKVNELCLFKLEAGRATEPHTLVRSLLSLLVMPKVSPKHAAVAFLSRDEKDESTILEVRPLDGQPGLQIASNISAAFEWTPDGRSLVYVSPMGDEHEKLQSIRRITVLQENGQLMLPSHEKQKDGSLLRVEAPNRLPDPVMLATAIMLDHPTVQILPDGRVLFACAPAILPAAGPKFEPEPRLFLVAADGSSVQPVPTAPGDLPDDLKSFVVSPDGKYVAVVEYGTDAVAVVELSSGKTDILSPAHPNWHCRTMPSWKSATELTFAALQDGVPKWMLWSEAGGMRCISGKWPATATTDWLSKQEEASKPAETAPSISKP